MSFSNIRSRKERLLRFPSLPDLVSRAQRRIPDFAWDYFSQGTGREVLIDSNCRAFDSIQITPRYLRDVSVVDKTVNILGAAYALPFGMAPIGMAGLIWPGTEMNNAKAAKENNIPYILSTVACADIETMAANTDGQLWFQLYAPKNESLRWNLIDRAKASGVDVLVVTIDVPVRARRERSQKSGMSMTTAMTPRRLWQACLNPFWSHAVLRHGVPRLEIFDQYIRRNGSIDLDARERDPSRHVEPRSYLKDKCSDAAVRLVQEQLGQPVLLEDLSKIRDRWSGKLVVKGVLHPDDAKQCVALGADGIIVSNHGARQSDLSPPSIQALPDIREAVGDDFPIMLDSGVRSGFDVLRALVLGADFVFLGRAFSYGNAALGDVGSQHVVDILNDELEHSMKQHGIVSLQNIGRAGVSWRSVS